MYVHIKHKIQNTNVHSAYLPSIDYEDLTKSLCQQKCDFFLMNLALIRRAIDRPRCLTSSNDWYFNEASKESESRKLFW